MINNQGTITMFALAFFNNSSAVDPKNVLFSNYALYPLDPNTTKSKSSELFIISIIPSIALYVGSICLYYHFL